jgi:hypothetical protein
LETQLVHTDAPAAARPSAAGSSPRNGVNSRKKATSQTRFGTIENVNATLRSIHRRWSPSR